jgi:hypothetical protein
MIPGKITLAEFPVNPPGLIVQFPDGRPVNSMLPTEVEHAG